SPEGMKLRLDVAAAIAGRVKDLVNPSELLDTVAGEAASAETRQAVARAEARQQGLGLLLMAPGVQRREPHEVYLLRGAVTVAPPTPCGRRNPVWLGFPAEVRPCCRRARSAPGGDHPTRRARWTLGRRAGRRSRLRGPPRQDRPFALRGTSRAPAR